MPAMDSVMKVDAAEAVSQLKEAVSHIEGYQLESAISTTVDLIKDTEGVLADRLTTHLGDLLAEQLRQVSVQPLQPIN